MSVRPSTEKASYSNDEVPSSSSCLAEWKSIPMDADAPEARSGHTAVLYEHQMILHGGYIDGFGETAKFCGQTFAFCLQSHKWRALSCEGQSHDKVFGHTATVIDSDMYVFGGQDFAHTCNRLSKLHLRPTPKGTYIWTEVTTESGFHPISRWGQSAVSCHLRGRSTPAIVIFGGATLYSGPLNDLVAFEPGEGWNLLRCNGIPPSPRRRHTAAVHDCQMFVFGGRSDTQFFNDLFALDLRTLTWIELQREFPVGLTPRLPTVEHQNVYPVKRTGHVACVTSDGKMFVFGGLWIKSCDPSMTAHDSALLNDLWCLDLNTYRWKPVSMHGAGCQNASRLQELSGNPDNHGSLTTVSPTLKACKCEESSYYGSLGASLACGLPQWRSMGVAIYYKEHVWIHGGRDKEQPFNDIFTFYASSSPPSLLLLVARHIIENKIPY